MRKQGRNTVQWLGGGSETDQTNEAEEATLQQDVAQLRVSGSQGAGGAAFMFNIVWALVVLVSS